MKFKLSFLKIALIGVFLITSFPAFAQTTRQHDQAVALNNQGVALSKQKRYKEAVPFFTRSLSIEEAQSVLHNRAISLYRLKRYPEALADSNRMLTSNPGTIKALYLRAKIYEAQKNFTAAFDDFSELLRKKPDSALYALGRGNAAIETRKIAQGLDSYYYAVSLAQKGLLSKEDKNTVISSVKSGAGSIYAVIGLPSSSFLEKQKMARTSPDFDERAKVRQGELRFDGICASVDSANGVFSMDVLTVSFPNGLTKVLAQPKRKQMKLGGAEFANALNPQFSRQPKVGDFLAVVGTDSGNIVSPRIVAIATTNFTGTVPDVNFAAIGRPQFVLENRSYRAGTAFFAEHKSSSYMVCAWHLLQNDGSLPDKGAKQTLTVLKEVNVAPYAGKEPISSREIITREGFGMGEQGNDLTGDYFVMKTTEKAPTLPLSLERPIQYQSVWIAGQTVNEFKAKLYKGYVANSDDKELVLFVDDKENFVISAMSGAPILDSSGGVVGILLGGRVLENKDVLVKAAPVSALQTRFSSLIP